MHLVIRAVKTETCTDLVGRVIHQEVSFYPTLMLTGMGFRFNCSKFGSKAHWTVAEIMWAREMFYMVLFAASGIL